MEGDLFDRKMLEVLVCPISGGRLILNEARDELISPAAGRAYPIRSGVPMMTPNEARDLSEAERARYR